MMTSLPDAFLPSICCVTPRYAESSSTCVLIASMTHLQAGLINDSGMLIGTGSHETSHAVLPAGSRTYLSSLACIQ